MRVREVRFQIRSVDVFQHGDFRQIHNGQRRWQAGQVAWEGNFKENSTA